MPYESAYARAVTLDRCHSYATNGIVAPVVIVMETVSSYTAIIAARCLLSIGYWRNFGLGLSSKQRALQMGFLNGNHIARALPGTYHCSLHLDKSSL